MKLCSVLSVCHDGPFHASTLTFQVSSQKWKYLSRMLQNGSQNAAPAKSGNANFLDPLPWESEDANYDLINDTRRAAINLSIEPGRKSEQINSKNHVKNNTGVQWAANFRSKSLGCELDKEGRILFAKNAEDHTSQVFFRDGSHDCNVAELSASIVYMNSSVTTPPDQDQDVFLPKSSQICSDHMIHELDFSLGDLTSQKNQAVKILMPHYILSLLLTLVALHIPLHLRLQNLLLCPNWVLFCLLHVLLAHF